MPDMLQLQIENSSNIVHCLFNIIAESSKGSLMFFTYFKYGLLFITP